MMAPILKRELFELSLVCMRECVESGNFIIINREKNKAFISEYSLRKEQQRDMMLSLSTGDYFGFEESKNFQGGYVHKLCRGFELPNSFGEVQQVDVYVKFEIEHEGKEEQTVVISFHEAEHPVQYLFAD